MGYRFFYTFDVPPEKEGAFKEYMDELGARVMAKYCKNWRLFKLHTPLRGKPPMYIGVFEWRTLKASWALSRRRR